FRMLQDGLSVSDVAALYLSRAMVEAMSGWPLAAELHSAFDKIEPSPNRRWVEGGWGWARAAELQSAFDKIEASLNERMREFLATLPQVLSAKGAPGAGPAAASVVGVTRRPLGARRA